MVSIKFPNGFNIGGIYIAQKKDTPHLIIKTGHKPKYTISNREKNVYKKFITVFRGFIENF
jgi:hypothetical protein